MRCASILPSSGDGAIYRTCLIQVNGWLAYPDICSANFDADSHEPLFPY
jgi:hypothetical protein